MEPPTDDEIRTEVFTETMQETGREVEMYIQGMICMRDKWRRAVEEERFAVHKYIYERDEDKVYRREFGFDTKEPIDL
jgi:hypothetical protein